MKQTNKEKSDRVHKRLFEKESYNVGEKKDR